MTDDRHPTRGGEPRAFTTVRAAFAAGALLAACGGRLVTIGDDTPPRDESPSSGHNAGDAGLPPSIDGAPPLTPTDAGSNAPDSSVPSPPSCFLSPGQYDCGCYGSTGSQNLAVQCHSGSCNCISTASPPLSFPRSDACDTAEKLAETFRTCLLPGEPLPDGGVVFGECFGAGAASCGCDEELSTVYVALDCHGGTCTCMRAPPQNHTGYPFGNSCDDEARVEEAYRVCQ